MAKKYKITELPKAQRGAATFSDSLSIYNNALQQKAYYDKLKQWYETPKVSKWYDSDADIKKYEREHLTYDVPDYYTPQEKAKFNKLKNQIKNNPDPNISYIVDMITGALDPNAPALKYDRRIKPQGTIKYDTRTFSPGASYMIEAPKSDRDILYKLSKLSKDEIAIFEHIRKTKDKKIASLYDTYDQRMLNAKSDKNKLLNWAKSKGLSEKAMNTIIYKKILENKQRDALKGFNTTLPYYDPIAVKPANQLTDEEFIKRFNKYGASGLPKSRIEKLGLKEKPKKTQGTGTTISKNSEQKQIDNFIPIEEPVEDTNILRLPTRPATPLELNIPKAEYSPFVEPKKEGITLLQQVDVPRTMRVPVQTTETYYVRLYPGGPEVARQRPVTVYQEVPYTDERAGRPVQYDIRTGSNAPNNKQDGGDTRNDYIEIDADDTEIGKLIAQGYVVEELPKAQEGIVQSVTPYPEAPEVSGDPNMRPAIYEAKDVTVKAKGPEWARYQREYQKKDPWERFLQNEQSKYLRRHKGLNKAAGVTMDNFPEAEKERIRQRYNQKMNTYITRRLGQNFGFNPNRRGDWLDLLTDKEREIVAGSKYGSKLQPSAWSNFLSGARSIYNAIPDYYKPTKDITAPIPGLTAAENKERLHDWMAGADIFALLDIPGIVIANKMKNMNVENPSWYSGETMGNVNPWEVMALNPLTYTLDAPFLAEGLVNLGRGVAKGSKAVGKYLTTQTPLRNAYNYNPLANRLGEYNRVVGQDAIDDIVESGLVRVNENAGVAQDLGPFGIVNRTTPYPSFGKAKPQQVYANQVINQGKTPYIISTDRSMRPSTLGRHGKGKTQFPVDDAGNYITGFPANEAKVFEFGEPHWLKGYKEVPIELPGSPNSVPESSMSGIDYNVLINSPMYQDPRMRKFLENEMRLQKEGVKHELLPESKSLSGQELFNDFKKRIRTEEGRKRLKALGISNPEKFDDYVLKEIENSIAYHKDSPFHTEYIGLHKDIPENIVKKITRHELEHAVQRVLRRPGEFNTITNETTKQQGLTEIDDILEGLEFKGTPTSKEQWTQKPISEEPIEMPSTAELFSDPQRNLDYFVHGSEGKERSAFLGEVQQGMLEDGTISDVYENITPDKVKEAYTKYMENKDVNKYKLRLFEIITPSEKNFKKISKALNKMLVMTPIAVGIDAATSEGTPEKQEFRQRRPLKLQYGGENMDYMELDLSPKEIQWYIDNGYTVEDAY